MHIDTDRFGKSWHTMCSRQWVLIIFSRVPGKLLLYFAFQLRVSRNICYNYIQVIKRMVYSQQGDIGTPHLEPHRLPRILFEKDITFVELSAECCVTPCFIVHNSHTFYTQVNWKWIEILQLSTSTLIILHVGYIVTTNVWHKTILYRINHYKKMGRPIIAIVLS